MVMLHLFLQLATVLVVESNYKYMVLLKIFIAFLSNSAPKDGFL